MSKNSTVYDCTIIELDKHHRDEGNITVVENVKTVPFEVKRTYYLYDIPGGEARGGHAHKELFQLVIAASGSFNVTVAVFLSYWQGCLSHDRCSFSHIFHRRSQI